MSRNARILFITTAIWVAIDQATKLWAYSSLEEGRNGDHITVIPGLFDLVHAENPGAAWSMFAGFEWRVPFFLAMTAFACWIVWHEYHNAEGDDPPLMVALGLILSGALGNGIDRAWKGTVTDFLRFYSEKGGTFDFTGEGWEYPSFNVADSTLLVGVIAFLFLGFRKREPAASDDASGAAATSE